MALYVSFTETLPFEKLTKKRVVLRENPKFIIDRQFTSKLSESDYFISFKFISFKDSLNIMGNDLYFSNRDKIKKEIKSGDTIEISYHPQFLTISQIEKHGVKYMNPRKAFDESDKIEFSVLLLSISALFICVLGFILSYKNIKFIGWICTVVILLIAIFVFIFTEVTFTDPTKYKEFY
ncbi:MAG: hypothetical protein HYU67_03910 [Flavobacteriia bacterium]|nr:hypothetical protein [Flavobacteriia bacterium]